MTFVATPASGYPNRERNCPKPVYQYEFVNSGGVTWTTTQKNEFNNSADNWDNLKSPGNTGGGGVTNLYSSAELTASVNDIRWGDLATAIGQTQACGAGDGGVDITLDQPSLLNTDGTIKNLATYRWVVAHEIGHAHGLRHSGRLDNQDGTLSVGITPGPVMMTCGLASDKTSVVQTDDYANAISERYSAGVNANQSFEAGTTGWRATGGLSWSVQAGAASEGNQYAVTSNPPNASTLTQPVRVERPDPYSARINYRRVSGSAGTITMEIQARRIDYPSAAGAGCEDGQYDTTGPGNVNYNDPQFYNDPGCGGVCNQWYMRRQYTFVPSSSAWAFVPLAEIGMSPGPWSQAVDEGWHASDIRILVRFNSVSGTVYYDNARIRFGV
jgi:hypothetical protein